MGKMRQGWYRKQARRVHRAFAIDFDNRARIARYQRRDNRQVDTTTGEIIEPAPGGVREKVLAFAFGEKKPAGAGSRSENYGGRAAAPISGYIKSLPKGRVFKRVVVAVALTVCALGILFYQPDIPRPVLPEGTQITYETRWDEGFSYTAKVYELPDGRSYDEFRHDWYEEHREGRRLIDKLIALFSG